MSLSFYKLSSWQYQKRSNSARLPSKMESWVQLTASCQCVLWFSNSTCLKYCACHEKVRPGHTKCCACHAKSSQQTWRSDAPNFSSVIATGGSAPATLQRQLFDPRSYKALEKQGVSRLFYLLRAWVFFLLPFSSLIFFLLPFSPLTLATFAFPSAHIVGRLSPKFLLIMYCYIYIHDYYYHHYHNSHSTGHLEGIRCSW